MNRLAVLLLLVGGVLLISWAVAPAAPVTSPRHPTTSEPQTAPVVQQLNADVDRLRHRLGAVPKYPAPARDPFRYGRRAGAIAATSTPAPERSPEIATPVAPQLPRLLAILADTVDGVPTFRAVMALGAEIAVVKAGDSVGGFRVRAITGDTAELVDVSSLRIFRLVLK